MPRAKKRAARRAKPDREALQETLGYRFADPTLLDRALVQFKLVESIEQQENEITALIEECRGFFAGSDTA